MFIFQLKIIQTNLILFYEFLSEKLLRISVKRIYEIIKELKYLCSLFLYYYRKIIIVHEYRILFSFEFIIVYLYIYIREIIINFLFTFFNTLLSTLFIALSCTLFFTFFISSRKVFLYSIPQHIS